MKSLTRIPEQLVFSVVAICGPSFAVIDGTLFDHGQICYNQILQGIPEYLVHITQVVIIFTPEQLRRHSAVSSVCDECDCRFRTIDLDTLPEGCLIIRSWFPPLTYRDEFWREASVSIGGMLAAGCYLHQRTGKNEIWKLACWSSDESQEAGSWERFDVSHIVDAQYSVRVCRHEYQVSPKVYKNLSDMAKSSFWDEEREIILRHLQNHLVADDNARFICANLFEHARDGNRHALDIAFIPEQAELRNDALNRFLLVPCIPVFVGELHYVVPVGDFSVDYFGEAVKAVDAGPSLQEYRLYELFDFDDILRDLLINLGLSRDYWEEYVHVGNEPFISRYSGGWTFVKDKKLAGDGSIEFLTIEPGNQKYPVWSNSGSGALAAAIVQDLLHPSYSNERVLHMKGWTQHMEISWIERAFHQKTILLRTNQKHLWQIMALVRTLGKFVATCDELCFIRDGRK